MEFRIVELLKEIKDMLSGKSKNDGYMDISEASQYCSVSISTIRRRIADGQLIALQHTPNGKLLFKRENVENWLDNGGVK